MLNPKSMIFIEDKSFISFINIFSKIIKNYHFLCPYELYFCHAYSLVLLKLPSLFTKFKIHLDNHFKNFYRIIPKNHTLK